MLLASIAATGLLASRLGLIESVALVVTSTMLMADDWHDRRMWFQRGWQSQA